MGLAFIVSRMKWGMLVVSMRRRGMPIGFGLEASKKKSLGITRRR
jgi:hypothetical protein